MKAEEAIEKKLPFINRAHNAIHLNFPNGNRLSTTWAPGTYSDNNRLVFSRLEDQFRTFYGTKEVEVMFNCGDKLHKRLHKKFDGDGSVIGYVSFTDWLYIVNALAKEPK